MLQEVIFVPVATLVVTAIMVCVGLLLAWFDSREASKPASQVRDLNETRPMQRAS